MMIERENNAVREQEAAYAAAGATQNHALVRELWAVAGQSDPFHVQRIANRSGLSVKWLSTPPKINGERGMDMLMEERNVLLLRDRKSPFIEQFQHPLGRCAKFYKLTAYNNCNFWCEYCYLFLTKSDCVRNLLEMKHGGQMIVSFSVNTDKVWQYLEHRTPSPTERLKAARKVKDAGYEVRLRIDPVVRYSTWEKDYRRLTEMIFDHVEPSRITIGEYRPAEGLSSHIKTRFPESSLLKVNGSLIAEAGKLRYPREFRIEMFRAIVDGIRRCDKKVQIALCKETQQVWKAVGLEGKGLLCNCTG